MELSIKYNLYSLCFTSWPIIVNNGVLNLLWNKLPQTIISLSGSGDISPVTAYCSEQPLWAHNGRSPSLWEAHPTEGSGRIALCRGVLIGGGFPVFSATGGTSKSRTAMLAFGPKRRPVCKGFRPQPWQEQYDFLIHSWLSQILLTFCSGAAEALRGKLSCKNTLSARACGHSFREANAISLLAYFGRNTFHIWRTGDG